MVIAGLWFEIYIGEEDLCNAQRLLTSRLHFTVHAGSVALPGAQDGELTANSGSLKAKLGAAVRDWKAKHREKKGASTSVDTAVQAEASADLNKGCQSRGWALRPYRVAQPPPLKSLRCGLPSPKYPSDHISLVADFSISRH